MSTEAVRASDLAIGAAIDEGGVGRPYPPSWVDRLVSWLEGLPGPTWLAYAATMVVGIVVSLVEPLLRGEQDPLILAGQAFWGVFVPLTLWLVQYLSDVAGTAFDAFRPGLTVPNDEAGRLRYGLTVTPARPAAIILVLSAILTPLYYIVDAEASGIVGLSPIGLALRYASEVFFGSIILVLILQSVRQLRAVGRIHESATRVDLFRPAPLYAFSMLTSRTAMVIAVVFIVPTLVAVGQNDAGDALLFVLPWIFVGIIVAAIVFVVPLRGMQRRIQSEKRRIQTEVGSRIESTMDAIHDRIDAGDSAGAGALHDVLQVLALERDLVDRLPTLPWRPGTLGAVISVAVVPIGLFVVTRLLERVI